MESEECVGGGNTPQQHLPTAAGRKGSKRLTTGMSEAQVQNHPHHHDKVLRSHTRRGRCAAQAAQVPSSPTPRPNVAAAHRRRQRSSCCSSHTDEEDGIGGVGGTAQFGQVSVSLVNFSPGKGKLDQDCGGDMKTSSGTGTAGNNNKAAAGEVQAGEVIVSSSACFPPTNETKELVEQAGLLGGPTKTTTIHSGGTRLSSSCNAAHNELATQQCRSSNAGEHTTTNKGSDNCSQNLIQAGVMGSNNATRSCRRSRQHGNYQQGEQQSTPPAAAAAVVGDDISNTDHDGHDEDEDGNNVGRPRRSVKIDQSNDEEMCGEDAAASCELPGKQNAVQLVLSSSSKSQAATINLLAQSVTGTLSLNSGVAVVKSECADISAVPVECGKGKGEKGSKRWAKEPQEIIISGSDLVSVVKREVCEISGNGGAGPVTVNTIGGHDGRWKAGENAKRARDKDGAKDEKKVLVGALSSSVVQSAAGSSMPQQKGLVKQQGMVQDDAEIGAGDGSASAAIEQFNKSGKSVGLRASVKKSGSSKKATATAAYVYNNNNNNTISGQSGGAKGGGGSGERKKALVPAPMLLMNNLPYMGELTFDTRPRRGRKPKKADICHLISKNYGIQFPAGVTQAAPASTVPINTSTGGGHGKGIHASHSNKKTAATETITVSGNNSHSSGVSRGLVPPAFCNRDVSIVPIIPTTWGNSAGAGATNPHGMDTKCSTSSASNLLKPLSSLAHQLMLQHQSSALSSSAGGSARGGGSGAQQSISMFPLSTPSSFSHSQHLVDASSRANYIKQRSNKTRELDAEEDEDAETLMEVDIEGRGDGDEDEDNQDSPLNLCMRDSSQQRRRHHQQPVSLVKEESLDVRWGRGGGGGGGARNKVVVRSATNTNHASSNNYSSDGANSNYKESSGGSNKRALLQSSSGSGGGGLVKGGKSAKLGTSAVSCHPVSSSLSYSLANSGNISGGSSNSVCDSDNVNYLVSCVRPVASPVSASSSSAAASQYGSAQATSKLSPNIFAISAHHLQQQQQSQQDGVAKGKNKAGGQSRKKKEASVRGDISISSAAGSSGLPSGGVGGPGSTAGLSSFGGTLFGQSTGGLNDAAEVSICKFKFTGGAKPCLQEKKMLSVDSGGNFRFYSDKTSGTGGGGVGSSGKLAGKGNQQTPPLSSSSGSSSTVYSSGGRDPHSPPSAGDLVECHYALSSLPKSAKSMSMCMPQGAVSNSGVQIQMSNSSCTSTTATKGLSTATKLSLPLIPSTSTGNPYAALSISPTTEELQQLHLSMQDQAAQGGASRSSSRVSPYPPGDYSYSSSNSCSSSDNGFGGDAPFQPVVGKGSSKQSSSGGSSQYRGSGGKMKLKRKRRTRKSLMREKLEKTFKEKGFLIQTQQLESAEGATYCKFRQLRKFTRYLFRSWKDYLPDHVKEISDNNPNNTNNNGTLVGGELQPVPNNQSIDQPCTGIRASNVQNSADNDGEDLEDEDEDGEEEEEEEYEEEEADSEEHPRQSLISQESSAAAAAGAGGEDSEDDDPEYEERLYKGKRGRKGKCATAVAAATVKQEDVDEESNKEEENEDMELQVDA